MTNCITARGGIFFPRNSNQLKCCFFFPRRVAPGSEVIRATRWRSGKLKKKKKKDFSGFFSSQISASFCRINHCALFPFESEAAAAAASSNFKGPMELNFKRPLVILKITIDFFVSFSLQKYQFILIQINQQDD